MNRRGFSLVEVMVAVTLLAVGVLLLAGGSLSVTRDLVDSRMTTVATGLAQSRLDDLRMWAAAQAPRCSSPRFSSSPAPLTQQGVSMSWEVPASGMVRTVVVITTFDRPGGGTETDSLLGVIQC